ncbi:MAG: response regulator [Acidobacteriota bacterium]
MFLARPLLGSNAAPERTTARQARKERNESDEPILVLLVEDSDSDALLLKRSFQDATASFEVTRIRSAEPALEHLASSRCCDIVVLDNGLPGTRGMDLAHEILERYPSVPVVMVTGSGDEALAVEALKAGVEEYVVKQSPDVFRKLLPALLPSVVQRRRESDRRREAELALLQSEALLDGFMRNSPAIAFIKDDAGRYEYVNPRFESFFQVDANWLCGRTDHDLWPRSTADELREHDRDVLARNEALQFVEVIPQDDGDHHWLMVKFPTVGRDQRRRIGGMAIDITETHRAKQAQAELEKQLLQAQKRESLGLLAGGVAHDFNNLLVGILGNAELALCRPDLDEDFAELLEGIQLAGERAAELTRQMLGYAGQEQVARLPTDLNELISEMRVLLGASVPKTVQVDENLHDDLPPVMGDRSRLSQVLMNLITNAAEAIGDGPGRVELRSYLIDADEALLAESCLGHAARPGEHACFEVHDDGCGMDERVLAQAFDPFFTTKSKGRGLGLAATLGIIRAHGGAVLIDTAPGMGTSFRVLLPVCREPALVTKRDADLASPRGAGRSILVVDDEELVLRVAELTLRGAGFRVLTALNGAEGLHAFERHADELALVLIDLNMPDTSGDQLLRKIRRRSEVPAVLATGFDVERAERAVTSLTTTQRLQKPYGPQELLSVVGSALSGARTPG